MGNIHSSRSSSSIVKPFTTKDLVDQFISGIEDLHYPRPHKILQQFRRLLLAQSPSLEECRKAISYYNSLAEREDHFLFFNSSIYIATKVKKIWLLQEKTLEFFIGLAEKNKVAFDELLQQLAAMCNNKLFLKAHHVDTLAASLTIQMKLPPNVLTSIELFLDEGRVNYKEELKALRLAHGPELDAAAIRGQKLHHAAAHALEIKVRTMLVMEQLRIFSFDNSTNEFLKNIISFMIEFHDHEQLAFGTFNSLEETTADRILSWLEVALRLDSDSALKSLLAFVANQIIVLGTTMVYSPVHTRDLAELYFLVESTAERAGLITVDPSNRKLSTMLEACMLITGICDKNPASVYAVVESQLNDASVSTLRLIIEYTQSTLLMDFFNSAAFIPYFISSGPCSAVDFQAFFITLAPHLSMRVELLAREKPKLVDTFIGFIAECRIRYLTLDKKDFIGWYEEEFVERGMTCLVQELFFSFIQGEVEFSLSQIGGLKNACERLVYRGVLAESSATPQIEVNVPKRDAINIIALGKFYKKLDSVRQQQLTSELVMAVIVQAGVIYSHQAGLGYYNVTKTDIEKPIMARYCFFTTGAQETNQAKDRLTAEAFTC